MRETIDNPTAAMRFATSWSLCIPEFKPILDDLLKSPPSKCAEDGFVNSSNGKYVWHLLRKTSDGEFDFCFKMQKTRKFWRYLLRPSLTPREARNYAVYRKIGIPVPDVLAVVEIRKSFVIKENFIATRFVENSRDARVFMPGGTFRSDIDRIVVFAKMNMELFARIHDNLIFHKASHVRNVLWREQDGKMQIFWIDVARCRRVSRRVLA